MQSLKGNNFTVIPAWSLSEVEMKAGIHIMILLLFFNCSNKTFNTEVELLDYLKNEENGYKQSKLINGIGFSLMYKPTDLLVKQELNSQKKEKKDIDSLRAKYGNYLYFTLNMSKNNQELLSTVPKNRQEFGAMVNQLAFGMDKKVYLYNKEKDTLNMVDYIYPRMYGMSRSTSMLFVYPNDTKKLKSDYLNFTIEDLGMYTGEVRFKIQTKKIKKQPKLNL